MLTRVAAFCKLKGQAVGSRHVPILLKLNEESARATVHVITLHGKWPVGPDMVTESDRD